MLLSFISVIALLCFIFAAPLNVIILAAVILLVVSNVVRFSARVVAGTTPSHVDALRAVLFSLLLVVVAATLMLSFMMGSGSMPHSVAMISGPVVIISPLIGYTLGFRLVLGVDFLRSAVIALLSTVLSVAILIPLGKVLHA